MCVCVCVCVWRGSCDRRAGEGRAEKQRERNGLNGCRKGIEIVMSGNVLSFLSLHKSEV